MRRFGRRLSHLERRIVAEVGDLVGRFRLIEPGDRVMACVSGGKDSYALLDVLTVLRYRAPVEFEIVAVNVDQGWPGYRQDVVAGWLEALRVEAHLVRRDHCSVVSDRLAPGKIPCSLCSRLRRGAIYGLAEELRCTKIALGHHLDDAIETLLLNLFFTGRLASLPPLLRARDGHNIVIRPLVSVAERQLALLAAERRYPIARCACPFTCTSVGERDNFRTMLQGLERLHPRIRDSIRRALQNVQPDYLWTGGTGA